MSKTLNTYQKKTNDELKKLDKSFKKFRAKEFETNQYANILEKLFKAYYDYMTVGTVNKELFVDLNDLEIKIRSYLFKALGDVDYDTELIWDKKDSRDYYDATSEFWGLKRIALINKLKHKEYSDALIKSDEDFVNPISDMYFMKRQQWIDICKTIDQFVRFTNEKFPNWSSMKKSEKKKYINYLEESQDAPFLNDSKNIKLYIQFLSNFGLNQAKRAKASLLVRLNFPNVDDEKIALEIIEFTNLFFYSKTKK